MPSFKKTKTCSSHQATRHSPSPTPITSQAILLEATKICRHIKSSLNILQWYIQDSCLLTEFITKFSLTSSNKKKQQEMNDSKFKEGTKRKLRNESLFCNNVKRMTCVTVRRNSVQAHQPSKGSVGWSGLRRVGENENRRTSISSNIGFGG